MGITTEIRLRQLQKQEWLHACPLECWNYNNLNMFRNNMIAQILCIMNELGISIVYRGPIERSFNISGGKLPLIDILDKNFRKNKKSLIKKEIMFLEQISFLNTNVIREWQSINIEKSVMRNRGRTPGWYGEIRKLVTEDDNKSIKMEYVKRMEGISNLINEKLIYLMKISMKHLGSG